MKIYVASHRGMVGSGIIRALINSGIKAEQILTRTHAELDLTNQAAVLSFYEQEKPDQVYLAAANSCDEAPGIKVGEEIVAVDPRYFRPTEVETLLGNPTKAKEELGWVPEITLQDMVKEMVAYDLDQAKRHALLKGHGYDVNLTNE